MCNYAFYTFYERKFLNGEPGQAIFPEIFADQDLADDTDDIGSISASPTACLLRGYGRAGTQNDRLGAVGDAEMPMIVMAGSASMLSGAARVE